MSRSAAVMGVAGVTLLVASLAPAAPTPEQQCQAARYKAAGAYAGCQESALARLATTGDPDRHIAAASKCHVKYAARWTNLAAKAAGSGATCDAARFVDNGTTVTDLLTQLQWEKKTNLDATIDLANPHDADNVYSWSAVPQEATGTVFTDFLKTLNTSPCFAGTCDWRLPTVEELQSILTEPFPCGSSPCVDPAFGPTPLASYWTSTEYGPGLQSAWYVHSSNGYVATIPKVAQISVRAVRGGL